MKRRTHHEANQARLPEGYRLESWVTMAGKTWQVYDQVTARHIVKNQRTPRQAVDLTLRKGARE